MNAKEIIETILSHLDLKAPTFSNNIGVDYTRIFDIQREKTKKISGAVANAIYSKYPEFDLNWILTGKGEMLKEIEKTEIETEKFKSQLLVDPNSSQEQMRQSYLELIADLLQDNKRLNMEIKSLLRENTKLVKELAENKKAGASMDAKVADAV